MPSPSSSSPESIKNPTKTKTPTKAKTPTKTPTTTAKDVARFIAAYGVFGIIAVLGVTAAIVRDVDFMRSSSSWALFAIETFAVALLTSAVLVAIFSMTRGVVSGLTLFSVFFVQIALVHVLCQFSGVYSLWGFAP